MKRSFTILALAILLPFFASAQYGRKPVSIVSHLSGGYGGFAIHTGRYYKLYSEHSRKAELDRSDRAARCGYKSRGNK